MSATFRSPVRPWAAAHRTVLIFLTLAVVIAAAAVTIPLVLLRGPAAAPMPARAPAQVVQHVPGKTPPNPCELRTIGRPLPC